MLATVTVVGLIVIAVLIAFFFRKRRQDQISAMLEKRRESARVASTAEFVSGRDRMPVALVLTNDVLYYENPDLQANLDIARIDEVEYDDEVITGHSVPQGCRVLRIRSHGTAFEFVLSAAEAVKWEQALPARRIGQQATARVG